MVVLYCPWQHQHLLWLTVSILMYRRPHFVTAQQVKESAIRYKAVDSLVKRSHKKAQSTTCSISYSTKATVVLCCWQILQKAEFLKELKTSEAHLVALPHVHVQTVAIIGWPISMISAPECKRLSCGHKLTVTLRILTSLKVRSPTILPPTNFLPRGWIVKACVAQVTPTVGR